MGNCLMAGQGQAPARQAALGAGLPQSAGAVTLSKMCGSGMRAMMFAHDMLLAGTADVLVAGGMESMTNAPHLTFARKGAALRRDHACSTTWRSTAWKTPTTRAARWACSPRSASPSTTSAARRRTPSRSPRPRARKQANEDGSFDWEIAPVAVPGKTGDDRSIKYRRAAVQGQARQDRRR